MPPSPKHDPKKADKPENELTTGADFAKLITQVTGGRVEGLKDVLTRILESPEPVIQEDIERKSFVIHPKSAQALHDLMLSVADVVKANGRPIDRSNVGNEPHKKSIELLCAGLQNLFEILAARDALIQASASAALEQLEFNKTLEKRVRDDAKALTLANSEMTQAQARVTELEGLISRLRQEKADSDRALRAQIQSLTQAHQTLETKLNTTALENTRATEKVAALERGNQQLRQEKAATDTKLNSQQRELEQTRQALAAQQQKLQTARTDQSNALARAAELELSIMQMRQDKMDADARFASKIEELDRAQNKVQELEKQLIEAGEALNKLANDLKNAKNAPPPVMPAPVKTTKLPSPDELAVLVDKSPELRLALRSHMSTEQRTRTCMELKEPDQKVLALFDNDEVREIVETWREVWVDLYSKASPFVRDNNQRLSAVNTLFRARVTDDYSLQEKFRCLQLTPHLGSTTTRKIVEGVTMSDEALERFEELLQFDPRYLALLIPLEPELRYLVD